MKQKKNPKILEIKNFRLSVFHIRVVHAENVFHQISGLKNNEHEQFYLVLHIYTNFIHILTWQFISNT